MAHYLSVESGKAAAPTCGRVPTLPMLHVLASSDPADARLQVLLRSDLTDDALHAEAVSLLRANPAMDRSRQDLRRWADERPRDAGSSSGGPRPGAA